MVLCSRTQGCQRAEGGLHKRVDASCQRVGQQRGVLISLRVYQAPSLLGFRAVQAGVADARRRRAAASCVQPACAQQNDLL